MGKVLVSQTAGAVPTTDDLDDQDVAVNGATGEIYTKAGLLPSSITVSATAPTSPVLNQMWLDIS